MPEYQEILDTEVQPEAPLTSSLGVRFRDNPIALANGASGAPRIQTAAINNSAVTAQKINIQQRSFSGSLDNDEETTITVSDTNPLFPRLTTSEADAIAMIANESRGTGSRVRVKHTDPFVATRSYAVAWRYIA